MCQQSWIVIGRFAGTILVADPSFTATVVLLNVGMKCPTGSAKPIFPSSTSARIAVLVMAFVCDAIRKTVPVVIRRPASLSLHPTLARIPVCRREAPGPRLPRSASHPCTAEADDQYAPTALVKARCLAAGTLSSSWMPRVGWWFPAAQAGAPVRSTTARNRGNAVFIRIFMWAAVLYDVGLAIVPRQQFVRVGIVGEFRSGGQRQLAATR